MHTWSILTIWTSGVLAGMWPCGVIVISAELSVLNLPQSVCSGAWVSALLSNLSRSPYSSIILITWSIYCSLYLAFGVLVLWWWLPSTPLCQQPCAEGAYQLDKEISELEIVIDKMHFAGHIDAWCRDICDPHKHRNLDKVYTCTCKCKLCAYITLVCMRSCTYRLTQRYANRVLHGYPDILVWPGGWAGIFLLYICDLHNVYIGTLFSHVSLIISYISTTSNCKRMTFDVMSGDIHYLGLNSNLRILTSILHSSATRDPVSQC